MKQKVLAALIVMGILPAVAVADAGDILARVRLIDVSPSVSTSDTLSAVNTGVGHSVVPELDFTYMFTNNIGAELILGTSRHEVTTSLGTLGHVNALPPTVTLQYHFNPQGTFRPYAGVGLNYTRFYNADLNLPDGTKVTVDQNSWGGAVQIGGDYAINKDYFVNVDLKYITMNTDVYAGGAKLGKLDINPWVFGIGFGRKF